MNYITKILVAFIMLFSVVSLASPTLIDLEFLPGSQDTGQKPQSKVWQYGGAWYAAMPTEDNSSNGAPVDGVWIWKLNNSHHWVPILPLAIESVFGSVTEKLRADVWVEGDVVHALLHRENTSNTKDFAILASAKFDNNSQTYVAWPQRQKAIKFDLPRSETATIGIDSLDRMWLSTETNKGTTGDPSVNIYYSDPPYNSFLGPIELSTNIKSDDITSISVLPNNTVGVVWSNQKTNHFEFKYHVDGSPPGAWSQTEIIPESKCYYSGNKSTPNMSDDHLNAVVHSDGTLYVAVKTSFDKSNCPVIGLLRRKLKPNRLDGEWSGLIEVDVKGTRPIVLLNELKSTLQVVYAKSESSGGDIIYKETDLFQLDFSHSAQTLFPGYHVNVTGPKNTWVEEVLLLTEDGEVGAIISDF